MRANANLQHNLTEGSTF